MAYDIMVARRMRGTLFIIEKLLETGMEEERTLTITITQNSRSTQVEKTLQLWFVYLTQHYIQYCQAIDDNPVRIFFDGKIAKERRHVLGDELRQFEQPLTTLVNNNPILNRWSKKVLIKGFLNRYQWCSNLYFSWGEIYDRNARMVNRSYKKEDIYFSSWNLLGKRDRE